MNTSRPRFAMCGKMHSGKNTVASYLVKEYGFFELALADELKDLAVGCINLMLDSLERGRITEFDRSDLERDKSVFRPFLQWVGTEFGRQYLGPDTIWIDKALEKVGSLERKDRSLPGVVITDVRFPNEVSELRRAGFEVLKVVRDEEARVSSIAASLTKQNYLPDEVNKILADFASHASEAHVDTLPYDWYLENDHDPAYLFKQVDAVMHACGILKVGE